MSAIGARSGRARHICETTRVTHLRHERGQKQDGPKGKMYPAKTDRLRGLLPDDEGSVQCVIDNSKDSIGSLCRYLHPHRSCRPWLV